MAHICHDLRRFSTLVGSRVLLCEVIKIAISGSAKSVLHFFNTKELIHEWYIHLQMRIVCVGWKAPCLKKIIDHHLQRPVPYHYHHINHWFWLLTTKELLKELIPIEENAGFSNVPSWGKELAWPIIGLFTYWILPHPICLPSKGYDHICRLRSMKHRVAQLLIWIILSYNLFVHLWPWY